jgi:predicted nuclease of predicted toxin-antitoxin system
MQPDWKIWLDNHISPVIAKWLKDDMGIEVKSSYTLQYHGLKDLEIYQKQRSMVR